MNRRKFITSSVTGAAILPLAMSKANRVIGSNDKVQIALIGCGGRGRYVTRGLIESGARLIYLCDLSDERLDKAEIFLNEVQVQKPKRTKDMHTVFSSNDVDAVVIATPEHWHGLASILAVQAGKDVYVEKPHAHNIWESLKMIEAAKKYNRFIQAGTQNRSAPYNNSALEYVKSGKLGRIGLVKVYNLKPGKEFRLGKTDPAPSGFNWDAWLGPASERPYHKNLFRSGWHNFWDYSGGDLANDGIHQLDLAMMLMGDPKIPENVACIGGRKVFKDDREVPDVQVVSYEFNDFIMTFELTNYPRYMQKTTTTIRRNDILPYWTQNATRIELYGSELMMTIGRHGGGWQVTTSGGKVVEQKYGRPADEPHYHDFIESVKNRKLANADITIAHKACVMIHMANIAHIVGNASLKFDTAKNQFIDHNAANNLIKRKYRKPYEVPENN
jgi:predicted dehydrogenase